MESLKIILVSVGAAIAYGLVHDQVTARICVEYFSIAHPRVIPSEDPTLLALVWGVLATWWVGLGLGALLALAARAGSRPKLVARDLVRPIAVLLACMAATALGAAVFGASVSRSIIIPPRIPPEAHDGFVVAAFAHSASYAAGFLGGTILCVVSWRRRGRLRREALLASVDEAARVSERDRLNRADRTKARVLSGASLLVLSLGLCLAIAGRPAAIWPCGSLAFVCALLAFVLAGASLRDSPGTDRR